MIKAIQIIQQTLLQKYREIERKHSGDQGWFYGRENTRNELYKGENKLEKERQEFQATTISMSKDPTERKVQGVPQRWQVYQFG